ncbi:helix-turn-helix transcriptional regulator [Bythopirellula goksoeyrii]|uniref:Helix-turn-helix protein n=1 Tax=Bythopirellula goksoeyrii TaxID=1400387 RepID=A0A5B9QKE5_9BACT|nr:helix-turn-helix transcriptional regulator [Bythopirellula goksoeyrii]QEG38005.1 helix-turn-helix protein [Bythopirellula goksoeyrii]
MARQAKSIFREFTPAENARLAKLREKLDKERPEIEAMGRAFLAAEQEAKRAIADLRAERERQGLSLADVSSRCGITRETISALETNEHPNPTMKTLQRYAMALGKTLQLSLGN